MAMSDKFDDPDEAMLRGEAATAGLTGDTEAPASATMAVIARHHDRLMATEGVVMVGEGRTAIGDPAVTIGVKHAGQIAGLPRDLDGVPVAAEVIGEIDILPTAKPAR